MPDTPTTQPAGRLRLHNLRSLDSTILEARLTDASRAIAAVDELQRLHWRAVFAGEELTRAQDRLDRYLETEAHRGNTDERAELEDAVDEARFRAADAAALRHDAAVRGGPLFLREVQVQAVWNELVGFIREWNKRRMVGEPATTDFPDPPAIRAWNALVDIQQTGPFSAASAVYRMVRDAGLDEDATRALLKTAAICADGDDRTPSTAEAVIDGRFTAGSDQ